VWVEGMDGTETDQAFGVGGNEFSDGVVDVAL
jgi:hypothetical protein